MKIALTDFVLKCFPEYSTTLFENYQSASDVASSSASYVFMEIKLINIAHMLLKSCSLHSPKSLHFMHVFDCCHEQN